MSHYNTDVYEDFRLDLLINWKLELGGKSKLVWNSNYLIKKIQPSVKICLAFLRFISKLKLTRQTPPRQYTRGHVQMTSVLRGEGEGLANFWR